MEEHLDVCKANASVHPIQSPAITMSSPIPPAAKSNMESINVNSFKLIVIIPAAGCSERFKNRSSSIPISLRSGYSSPSPPPLSMRSTPSPPPSNGHSKHQRQSSMGSNLVMHHYYRSMPAQHKPDDPKQFNIVCHKPLIFHTVSAFLKLKWIDHIIVLGPTESLDQMEEVLSPLAVRQFKRFDVIPGGETRHASIKLGLQFIASRALAPDLVIVHDGARPYVDGDTVHRLLDRAHHAGAAGCVCKLSSTIVSTQNDGDKQTDEENMVLEMALDRTKYWASETPQAFRYDLLKLAYDKASTWDLAHGTECLDLVQRYAHTHAHLVPVSPSHYFKVTYRKDLYAADNILKEHRNILLHCDFLDSRHVDYKLIKELKDDLVSNFENVKYFNNSGEMSQTNHFYGTVHVLLHYTPTWKVVLQQALGNYENCVYIVINNETLPDEAYPALVSCSRAFKSREMRNFYLVFVSSHCLPQENVRLRNTIVYLCKELPAELTGQTLFI